MPRERKRDALLRHFVWSKDRLGTTSQADNNEPVSSTSELTPTAPPPLRTNTPDSTQQVGPLDLQQEEPETPNDVWAAAFRKFQESDVDLAKAYVKLLNPAHEEGATKFDVDFVKWVVERLDEKRDEKQWKVAFAGKSIHIRSQVEKIVKFLLWTDSTVVKPALSTQPYAALAWSAVSIFLPLVKAGTELHGTMLDGLEEINHMLVFWNLPDGSAYSLRSPEGDGFYSILIDLHHRIIRYYARAVCHLSATQFSRAWENLVGWNDWEAEIKSINALNLKCQNCLETAQRQRFQDSMEGHLVDIQDSLSALKDISKSLEEIRFQYEDQVESRLLRSLHADFKGHKNANPERVQGTCEWVLQDPEFHQWRDSEFSSLIWVSAGPGYGKSVLSRFLIDEKLLQSPTRATTSSVCHFFFKDGHEKRTRACDAVAALLHQLFCQDLTGNLIKKAKTPYHRAGAGLRESFDELCDILTSCIHSPDAGEIIFLLDAFDECEASERKRIANYLSRFYNTCQHDAPPVSSLKVFITSRNLSDIKFSFEGLFEPETPSRNSHINGDEALSKIREEIKLVIKKRLPTIVRYLPKSDQEYLGKRMEDMENRTYLWVCLFFQIIEANRTKYTKKTEIIALLESLPSEIQEVYEKILQPFYDDEHTKLLLQLVLAASRPLTLKEANEALTVLTTKENQWKSKKDFDSNCWVDFRSLVQNSTGLLVVVTKNDELLFLHQTVREFLLGPRPAPTSWRGRFNYSETHTTMLSACLKLLPILALEDNQDERFLDDGLLNYAVGDWPAHYERQAHDEKDENYHQARLLCDTTQPSTVSWLKCNYFWTSFRKQTGIETRNFDVLTIAAFFGLAHLVEKITETESTDSSRATDILARPLQAASWNGQLEIVKILVRNNADIEYESLNLGSAMECAIGRNQVKVVEFLLTCTPVPIIRNKAMELAAGSSYDSRILKLLLQRFPDMEVSERLLESAAGNPYCCGGVVEILLHQRPGLMPSDQTLLSAIENLSCSSDVLVLLLDKRPDLHITEAMVEKACDRRSDVLEFPNILHERSPDTRVIDRGLVLAAKRQQDGPEIVKFFSEKHSGLKIPQEAFCEAARNESLSRENKSLSVEMLRLLFEVDNAKQVTPDLILSAMFNWRSGKDTLDFLACQDGFSLTQGQFETWFQTEQNRAFFENLGHVMRMGEYGLTITETIMKAVASWTQHVEMFLGAIGTEFPGFVTDDIYNESHQACQASRGPDIGLFDRHDRYSTMRTLLKRVDIRMKGDDGHRLTRGEAMAKLELWRRELEDFYATDTDSVDDTLEAQ